MHSSSVLTCVMGLLRLSVSWGFLNFRETPQKVRCYGTCGLGEPTVNVSLLYNLVRVYICVQLNVQLDVFSL